MNIETPYPTTPARCEEAVADTFSPGRLLACVRHVVEAKNKKCRIHGEFTGDAAFVRLELGPIAVIGEYRADDACDVSAENFACTLWLRLADTVAQSIDFDGDGGGGGEDLPVPIFGADGSFLCTSHDVIGVAA